MVSGGEAGVPSVTTMWQPTPNDGLERARAAACSKAGPVAMRVAEVRTPAWWSSMMARLMPEVRPKSSALMMIRGGMGERFAKSSNVRYCKQEWKSDPRWSGQRFGRLVCSKCGTYAP